MTATVLVPERDGEWRRSIGRIGRFVGGSPRASCRRVAVVECRRGSPWRFRWWAYCAEHSYGRVALADGIYHAVEWEEEG